MIKSTKDYSIFKKHPNNRELDSANLKKITASILSKNLLNLRPILVNKEMQVVDGQHRLQVAKDLNLEVFYEIHEEMKHEDIVLLNNQKSWTVADYFNYYLSLGKKEYIKLDEFMKQNEMDLKTSLSFLGMQGGAPLTSLKAGTVVFPNEHRIKSAIENKEYINKIKKIILECKVGNSKYINAQRFSDALLFILRNEEVDPNELLRKIEMNLSRIYPCARREEYFIMFKDIYNFKRKDPLSFNSKTFLSRNE